MILCRCVLTAAASKVLVEAEGCWEGHIPAWQQLLLLSSNDWGNGGKLLEPPCWAEQVEGWCFGLLEQCLGKL